MEETDTLEEIQYIEEKDVTVVLKYMLDFDAGRTCGTIAVYQGRDVGEDAYEIYMEVLDCRMQKDRVISAFQRVIDEIKRGDIEV
ncbi:hypothetical protein [Thermoplasma acidophilum]|uniref:Uncharacterized protein n=1 Tax=Thermoplasma acidophilum (strain ATCC 25905 / DSM 1728 / JCM 9062 / NBRC 15155 / AMRC-C165) TaxID=273075 RepID=Q9HJA5_THEAC|nr:hypothetical protein [Thermoplasma acidophilum]MCY0851798.1 hypothetical protein [Thermoplasma acidophilum]CAC12193.1 hypothetical protein [Thermoplasma acidophilum]